MWCSPIALNTRKRWLCCMQYVHTYVCWRIGCAHILKCCCACFLQQSDERVQQLSLKVDDVSLQLVRTDTHTHTQTHTHTHTHRHTHTHTHTQTPAPHEASQWPVLLASDSTVTDTHNDSSWHTMYIRSCMFPEVQHLHVRTYVCTYLHT